MGTVHNFAPDEFRPGDRIDDTTVVASTFFHADGCCQVVIRIHPEPPYFGVVLVDPGTGELLGNEERVFNIGEATTAYEDNGGDVL